MNYTYIVQCADGTLYTGWTNCLEKRLKAHNSGKNGANSIHPSHPSGKAQAGPLPGAGGISDRV